MDIELINPLESFELYHEAVEKLFAFAGFSSCPLDGLQLYHMYLQGFDVDAAFSVGSDVNAGFGFFEAIAAL